jgi:nitrogen fixation protein FixH
MSEKKSKWPMVIGGLLTVHVLASLFFVYLATSNPSFAVEEDYYQKALAFDEKRAQEARNRALGWTLDATIERGARAGEPAALIAHLADRSGTPLAGASVAVEAFPIARADHILRAELRAGPDGDYHCSLPVRRGGRWELRFDVHLGDERFTNTSRLFLPDRRLP